MNTTELLVSVVPVVLLFAAGFLFRKTSFLSAPTVDHLRKLVVNFALPALLFQAFLTVDTSGGQLLLAGGMFLLCGALLGGALLVDLVLRRRGGRGLGVKPYLYGGFEAGMLGYALFLSAFGNEGLPVFASVDLGQVLFVFVVLMPILFARRGDSGGIRRWLKNIVTSPVIWAIVLGLVTGRILAAIDQPATVLGPVLRFIELVGNLTVPLIAIAIGFGLSFASKQLAKALLFVLVRLAVLVGVILLAFALRLVTGDMLRAAFATMLILPPPFVVALAASESEVEEVSTILSVATVVSVVAFVFLPVLGV